MTGQPACQFQFQEDRQNRRGRRAAEPDQFVDFDRRRPQRFLDDATNAIGLGFDGGSIGQRATRFLFRFPKCVTQDRASARRGHRLRFR